MRKNWRESSTIRIKYVKNKMEAIQYITSFIIFFTINWLVWWVIDKKELVPDWLQYKPFICRTCCTFWVTIAVAGGLFIVGWWIAGISLAILATANLAAMMIDERNTTII